MAVAGRVEVLVQVWVYSLTQLFPYWVVRNTADWSTADHSLLVVDCCLWLCLVWIFLLFWFHCCCVCSIPGGHLRWPTTKQSGDSYISMVLNCFQSSFTFYLLFSCISSRVYFPPSAAIITALLKITLWGYLVSFVLPDWFRTMCISPYNQQGCSSFI